MCVEVAERPCASKPAQRPCASQARSEPAGALGLCEQSCAPRGAVCLAGPLHSQSAGLRQHAGAGHACKASSPRAGAARQVIGGPLASGLLLLDGRGGLFGWQWVFLVEGAATAAFGLVLLCALPRAPDTAWCLAPSERAALVARRDAERDAAERKDPSGGTTTRARLALTRRQRMPPR